MCYDPAARPPLPPISGGAGSAEGERIELEAADGNRFAAYSVRHSDRGGAGMVVLPDVRGLHPFYEELALRFADAGVHATALDYFGRTAGVAERDDDFEYMPHVQATTPGGIAADVAAAAAHLRSPEGGAAERLFTVGFCFGGRNSFNQAARDHDLAGVIGFYGFVAERDEHDRDAPTRLAAGYRCPVLGLFAGADRNITHEHVRRFDEALGGAGVTHHVEIYDGAPHSFFDRAAEEHAEASADAWNRMLGFVRTGDPGAA
ncbi:MAG TPA: dienelactone hydrolase family protein [Actinomycetota bacterium]|nr:dienelactone hydrolase family protein [Actinomycetota bacterium]